jgi:Raf kinase inhibitor-like YbhB/YbcL family protein
MEPCMSQKLDVKDLKVTSPAFDSHGAISDRHASTGEDVAPELRWSGVPEGTKAFALVVHDPDAPLVDGFTHWVAYSIGADAEGLPEGGAGVSNGTNSMGEQRYNGPAPPAEHGKHHYYFWLYALDEDMDLEPGLERRALLERIENHVIEQARLIGTFENSANGS